MDKAILESVGINYNEAIERFVGAAGLFEKFLEEMASTEVLEPLKRALNNSEVETAFKVAHTLKGNFGNLSIEPLYKTITPLVEELRSNNLLESQKIYIELEKQYDEVVSGIRRAM